MDKKINKRLLAAYAELIKKNEDKITVTLLCEKANISRASFYLYHKDIDSFIESIREYLINKFYKQMELILSVSDNELKSVLLRKNLVFDDSELKVLIFLALGSNFLAYAVDSQKFMLPRLELFFINSFGEDYYNNNRAKFEYFINGFVMMLYYNLINYDEEKIKFEIFGSRALAKHLFADAVGNHPDGNWYKGNKNLEIYH